jgi:hypothetical protein
VNLGDYRRPGTQTHKLLCLLLDMKPHTAMEIVRSVGTPAASTVVAGLRQGLDLFGSPYRVPEAEKIKLGDGSIVNAYRLERRAPVNLELFAGETVREPQGVSQ